MWGDTTPQFTIGFRQKRCETSVVGEFLYLRQITKTNLKFLLWMALWAAAGHNLTYAQRSQCRESKNSTERTISVLGDSLVESTPIVLQGGVQHEEWIFISKKSDNFLTINFSKFKLSGPNCVNTAGEQSFSRVYVKTDVDENWYCKDRRYPDTISSKSPLRVSYCNKYPGGSISFKVSSGCSTSYLVKPDNKEIVIDKKQNERCSIKLISADSSYKIRIQLSEVVIRESSSKRCKSGHISAKDLENSSLLPGKADKLCNIANSTIYQPNMNFNATANLRMSEITIAYKRAKFRLWFQLVKQEQTTTPTTSINRQDDFKSTTTNASASNVASDVVGRKSEFGHIIGIGCGGLFVLVVIIATLFYIRKRSLKTKETRDLTKKRVSPANTENGYPMEASIGSINNAMYDQIVRSDESEGRMMESNSNGQTLHHVCPKESINITQPADQEPGLGRRGTRPKLASPITKFAGENKFERNGGAICNVYERIDDVQTAKRSDEKELRPWSCATFTSDEFSDEEDDGRGREKHNYATMLDTPSHCQNSSMNGEYHSIAGDRSTAVGVSDYHLNGQCITRKVQLHVPGIVLSQASQSTPFLSCGSEGTRGSLTNGLMYSNRNASTDSIPKFIATNRYLSPRPSLPVIACDGSTVLAEDAQNYLSPRPSCPDVMANNEYSSTDDLAEIRQRLLAAAHPSLQDKTSSSASIPEANHYDSPRPSSKLAEECREKLTVEYATPRRRDRT